MTPSRSKNKFAAKRLVFNALLTAIALVISLFEAQIPPLVPIPGVKLGLANIVTVYAMFALTPADTLAILLCRIVLGSVFSGRVISMFYSLAGGLLCFTVMLLLRRILTCKQIWVCSVICAVFHNIGQILVAIVFSGTPAIIGYLPFLVVSGIITGLFTGLIAQIIVNRFAKGRVFYQAPCRTGSRQSE